MKLKVVLKKYAILAVLIKMNKNIKEENLHCVSHTVFILMTKYDHGLYINHILTSLN